MNKRFKDIEWIFPANDKGQCSDTHATIALLMDLRDELKEITRTLNCHNTLMIPRYLKRIASNTTKKGKNK